MYNCRIHLILHLYKLTSLTQERTQQLRHNDIFQRNQCNNKGEVEFVTDLER